VREHNATSVSLWILISRKLAFIISRIVGVDPGAVPPGALVPSLVGGRPSTSSPSTPPPRNRGGNGVDGGDLILPSPYPASRLSAPSWISGVLTVGLVAAAGVLGVIGSGASSLASAGKTAATTTSGSGAVALALAAGAAGAVAGKAATSGGAPNQTNAEAGIGSQGADPQNDTALPDLSKTSDAHAIGDSDPPWSQMDPLMLFFYLQFISTNGLLSINYPDTYQAFTVNFAWANFILPIASFRHAAERMRKCNIPDRLPCA
jgi:hypothetical protein